MNLTCRFSWLVALPVLLGASALPGLLAAQNVKLNGPLAQEMRSGSVSDFLFTQDGTRVVYRADREADLRFELFSRPLDGSGPSLKLNGPMHSQGDVGVNGNIQGSFAIGANDRVVYVADETVENVSELFSVPADGSASRVRLSAAGVNVYPFKLTPAKTHVLYENGSIFTFNPGLGPLFVVPVDGSAAPINLTPGRIVHRFWISPGGATTVISVDPTPQSHEKLYAVPSDGSAPPLLLTQAHPSPRFGSVYCDDVVFTPDGLRVVYNEVDDFDGDLEHELYNVPLDASQAETLITNGPFYTGRFVLDSDSLPARVAFQVNGGVASTAANGSQFVTLSPPGWTAFDPLLVVGTEVLFTGFLSGTGSTIFRVPSAGGAATALFPAAQNILTFGLAGPTEVALIRYFAGFARQLSVVPLAGGTPVPLHTLPPTQQGPFLFVPHPDGQRVLFPSDDDTAGVYELYVVPLDASSAPTKLSGPLASNEDVHEIKVTPDGAHTAFRAGIGNGGPVDLFQATLDGSSLFQVNEPIPGDTVGDVTGFRVTPDGASLVYRADQDSDEDFDLYVLDTSAPGSPLQLSSGLANVLPDFAFSPLSERVVFQTQGAPFALHNADLTGGSPIALDTSSAVAFPTGFLVSADGTRLVYRRKASGLNFELCSVAMDGLSAPVVLHAPLSTSRTVSQFQISPGGVVVFLSDLGQDEVYELYAVPVDGSAQPIRLSQTLATDGDVTSFQLDAKGGFAVYLADAKANNRFELYSMPLDATLRPVRLNGRLPAGGDVTDFALAPEGKRVVYRADQVSDNRFDLFSVPIGGPRPPHGQPDGERRSRVTLLSGLPSGRAVEQGWSISPDGTQVVFRADADTAGELELYRAPVDGSVAPAKLSAALVANGDVLSFAIAPDQSRVVYRADQRVDEVIEIFSAPFLGGTAVQLDLLPNFGDVSVFQIAPDSSDVVFLADRDTNAVLELFHVPLDGSGPSVKVNASLPAGGEVQTDFVALDDARSTAPTKSRTTSSSSSWISRRAPDCSGSCRCWRPSSWTASAPGPGPRAIP